jgi:hypothetical protein
MIACCAVVPCAEAINTGPLEATIHNLGKDIEAKGREGQELQRRWITRQTELVALQVGSWVARHTCASACTLLLADHCWLLVNNRMLLMRRQLLLSAVNQHQETLRLTVMYVVLLYSTHGMLYCCLMC